MARTPPLLAALALVIASGFVHGRWSGRWSASRFMGDRVAELRRVPLNAGDWKGEELKLDPRTVETGGLVGHLMRRYVNPKGDAVTLLVVCGRPGPIAVHTPEVCYRGTGYEQAAPASRFPAAFGAAARPDGFWSVDFRKPGPVGAEGLRVLYSWNADGVWTPSENPRLDFAGAEALFKMYVIRRTAGDAGAGSDDLLAGFLGQLLPELRKCLFAKTG